MAVEEPLSGSMQGEALPRSSGACVMGVQELVDNGLHAVPPAFVRPPSERPHSDGPAAPPPQNRVPVISLAAMASNSCSSKASASRRQQLLQEIGRACEQWGFFQVVDHGVEAGVVEGLQAGALRFFALPAEERMRFHSQVHNVPMAYLTSFNPSRESVREWKDGLAFNRFPGQRDGFLDAPDVCREEVQAYRAQVEAVAGGLYRAIFESLGMEGAQVEEEVPRLCRQRMVINYYPPCPEPSLALGLSSHSDVSSITVLHADQVPGLQIKHQGVWVPVLPIHPHALIVNLGDQIEILSNGKYKSVEHRACTNAEEPRISVACFFGPDLETVVAPLPIAVDDRNPLRYRPTKFRDYYENFLSHELLPDRGTLDFARIPTQ